MPSWDRQQRLDAWSELLGRERMSTGGGVLSLCALAGNRIRDGSETASGWGGSGGYGAPANQNQGDSCHLDASQAARCRITVVPRGLQAPTCRVKEAPPDLYNGANGEILSELCYHMMQQYSPYRVVGRTLI